MRLFSRWSLAALLVAGSSAVPSQSSAQDSAKVQRPTNDLITREQIAENRFSNLFELIEAVHNNWLIERMPVPTPRSSGAKADSSGRFGYTANVNGAGKSMGGEAGGIQVYIDGTRVGGTAELKNIRPAEVESIRRISGVDAQARFGIGHGSGVLYVLTLGKR